MNTLIINSGSSSIKLKIFHGKQCELIAAGSADGIGQAKTEIKIVRIIDDKKEATFLPLSSQQMALKTAFNLIKKLFGSSFFSTIDTVGHRVVHGGPTLTKTTAIDNDLLTQLRRVARLAPLHNRHNIGAIIAARKLLPQARHWAVFDTAFHADLPRHSYQYPLPDHYLERWQIRKYGFHGISHCYVQKEADRLLKKKNGNYISCHLGNGCSVTAIRKGKSIDTSMGFTPLEGLPMGSRCGDIDPALVFWLTERLGLKKAQQILHEKSGLLGLSEVSSDMRAIWAAATKKDPKALNALAIFCYRLAKYIGAYAAILNPVDALIFTGGIGENAWYVREQTIRLAQSLHLKLNKRENNKAVFPSSSQIVSLAASKFPILVIPTNEELAMARECLIAGSKK